MLTEKKENRQESRASGVNVDFGAVPLAVVVHAAELVAEVPESWVDSGILRGQDRRDWGFDEYQKTTPCKFLQVLQMSHLCHP